MRYLAVLSVVGLAVLLLAAAFLNFAPPQAVRADDDHSDYRSTATPLGIGTGEIAGHIDETSLFFDVDYFTFETRRGVRYTFTVDMVAVTDTNILVINSAERGSGVAEGQTVSWDGRRKQVEWVARTSDTYFLEVFGAQGTPDGPVFLGDYTLSATADSMLEDRHAESRAEATPISIGNQYQGAVSPWPNQPMYAGSVEEDYDHDYFSFRANRGVKYTIGVELDTLQAVEIAVRNQAGGVAASNGGVGSVLDWITPETGLYYVTLSGSTLVREPVGTYALEVTADLSLEDRHIGTREGATPINFGNQHQGAISPEDDRDYFSFQAVRGIKYDVNVALTTEEVAEISITDPAGRSEATNGGVGSSLEWIASSTATYYVVVSGSPLVRTPVGAYVLVVTTDESLEDRHSDTREGATQVHFGTPQGGAISPSDDMDFFYFSTVRGVKYRLDADTGTGQSVNLAILRPEDGAEAASSEAGMALEWIAPSTSIYHVVVSAPPLVRTPVGGYVLEITSDESLEDRHSDTQEGAKQVHFGTPQGGAISPADDVDFFYFPALRGVKYRLDVKLGTAQGVNLSIIRAEDGAEAASSGARTPLEWIAPLTETYFVVVTGSTQIDDVIGTYSLELTADTTLEDQHSDTREAATAIRLGTSHQGSISPGDDQDYFALNAKRGVEYEIRVDSASYAGINIAVARPVEGVEISNNGLGNRVVWIAPNDAEYYVVVSNSGLPVDVVGPYLLKVNANTELEDQRGEGLGDATSVNFGTVYLGAISPADDLDYFSFQTRRGVKYHVDAGPDSVVAISILGPGGSIEASNESLGSTLDWTASVDGAYIVALSGSNRVDDGVGTYALEITGDTTIEDRHSDLNSDPTLITFENRVAGAISPADDEDHFSFQATRGVKYTFELTYGTAEAVSLTVVEPGAVQGFSASNYGEGSTVTWLSPSDETYIITISAAPRVEDPVGTYFLKVIADSSLKDRHANDLTGATVIGFGNTIGGYISPGDDTDTFSFQGEQGKTYLVKVQASLDQEIRFWVTDPQSSYTESNYGAGDTLMVTAPDSATYYVIVSAAIPTEGVFTKYEVTVTPDQFSPTIGPVEGQTNARGAVVSGISLAVEARIAPPGGMVRVPIMLAKAKDVIGLAFSLGYDPTVLELVGVEQGSRLAPATFTYRADEPGMIRFGFALEEPITGDGSAAVVVFKVLVDREGTTRLSLTRSLVSDSYSRPLPIELLDGELTVGIRAAGDGDGDGAVTALDALIAMKMAHQLTQADLALDMDGDGSVTADDARQILAMAGPEREV
ncbi:MAG: hypothetical protein BZY88_05020 [SAR202 cluster bacterium Io17-Chloro-G9]|nr:MAG: hypothetical protein BZY88_05020 [SAR202 cluster bacterium Io17-Chloro-G9]